MGVFRINKSDRSRSRPIYKTRSIQSDEKEKLRDVHYYVILPHPCLMIGDVYVTHILGVAYKKSYT